MTFVSDFVQYLWQGAGNKGSHPVHRLGHCWILQMPVLSSFGEPDILKTEEENVFSQKNITFGNYAKNRCVSISSTYRCLKVGWLLFDTCSTLIVLNTFKFPRLWLFSYFLEWSNSARKSIFTHLLS